MLSKATIVTLTIVLTSISLGAFVFLKEDKLTSEVRSYLKDPSSAKFRNTETYDREIMGEVLCGEVNAVNSFGAYNGWKGFVYDHTGLTVEGEDPEYEFTAAYQCSSITNSYTTKAMTLINIGKQIISAQQLHMMDNSGISALDLDELLDGGYLLSKPVDIDVIESVWRIEDEGRELTAKIDMKHYEVCKHISEHPALNLPEYRKKYNYGCRETEEGRIFFMSQLKL